MVLMYKILENTDIMNNKGLFILFYFSILFYSCNSNKNISTTKFNKMINNEACIECNEKHKNSIDEIEIPDERIKIILDSLLSKEYTWEGDWVFAVSNITENTYQVKVTKIYHAICNTNITYYNNQIYKYKDFFLIISTDYNSNYFYNYFPTSINYEYHHFCDSGFTLPIELDQYYGTTLCQIFELKDNEIIDYGTYPEFDYYPDCAIKINEIREFKNPNYIKSFKW